MIKVKIEQWKEIVRFEVIDIGTTHFEVIDREIRIFKIGGNKIVFDNATFIANKGYFYKHLLDCVESINFLNTIKTIIKQYNNSIKDDGYKWICTVCDYKCKASGINYNNGEKPEYCCNSNTDIGIHQNWQLINNNKIEIVED